MISGGMEDNSTHIVLFFPTVATIGLSLQGLRSVLETLYNTEYPIQVLSNIKK